MRASERWYAISDALLFPSGWDVSLAPSPRHNPVPNVSTWGGPGPPNLPHTGILRGALQVRGGTHAFTMPLCPLGSITGLLTAWIVVRRGGISVPTLRRGRCRTSVDFMLECAPKLVVIDEDANDQIVHRHCFGKANRAAHETPCSGSAN